MLRVCRHADARDFLTRAESWLAGSEIEHAVALASARNARANDSHYERPIYWATIEDESQIVGCAFRTPPYRLGVSALPAAAIPVLVADVAALYPTLSGVAGTEPAASQFAGAWTKGHGGSWKVQASQRLFALRALEAPGSHAGRPVAACNRRRRRARAGLGSGSRSRQRYRTARRTFLREPHSRTALALLGRRPTALHGGSLSRSAGRGGNRHRLHAGWAAQTRLCDSRRGHVVPPMARPRHPQLIRLRRPKERGGACAVPTARLRALPRLGRHRLRIAVFRRGRSRGSRTAA